MRYELFKSARTARPACLNHDTGSVGAPILGVAAICACDCCTAIDLASASWITPCRICCSDASSTFVKESYNGGCSCCNPVITVNHSPSEGTCKFMTY